MFQVQGYFTGFGSRSDGGARLSFTTNEIGDKDFSELKRLLNGFGWIAFKENEFKVSDMPMEAAEDKNKTPSKRQRAILFLLWKKHGSKGNFDAYYGERMEKNIERLKVELDDAI